MAVQRVLVVGMGLMGSGIAQVCAEAGVQVKVVDATPELVQKGVQRIAGTLAKGVERGKLAATDRDQILGRITPIKGLDEATDVELAIEAVFEQMATKQEVFANLDRTLPASTILATNTSGLPVTEIASATKRPEKVIGTHFFNPAPVMKLVEVVRGLLTSDETYQTVREFCQQVGKTSVEVRDFPGFITTRIMSAFLNEAYYAYMEGVASAKDIDTACKLAYNHPMGPLELSDLIGLDTCLDVLEGLYKGYGDKRFFPCPILKKMVTAGLLGRKSGKGFHSY